MSVLEELGTSTAANSILFITLWLHWTGASPSSFLSASSQSHRERERGAEGRGGLHGGIRRGVGG